LVYRCREDAVWEVHMATKETIKQRIKRAKEAYSFAAKEMDRYAYSVFYVPGSAREKKYDAMMAEADAEIKRLSSERAL
jgi:hypothetical protein